MTDNLTVNPNAEQTRSSEDEVRTSSSSQTWSFVSGHTSRRVPLFVSRDQTYYWSREWQEGIRKSAAELEAGEYIVFDDPDDPEDVVRWLMSDED